MTKYQEKLDFHDKTQKIWRNDLYKYDINLCKCNSNRKKKYSIINT